MKTQGWARGVRSERAFGAQLEHGGGAQARVRAGMAHVLDFYFACPMDAHLLQDWFMGNKPGGGVDFSPSAIMEHIPT